MLPPLWSTSRAPATSFFRGSITRPQRSLSTLRSLPRGKTTQDSLASWWPTFAARDWLPAGLLSRFQLMFPPRPSLPGAMTIKPKTLARSGRQTAAAATRGVVAGRRGATAATRVGEGRQELVQDRHSGEGGDAGGIVAGCDFDHVEADDLGADERAQDLLQLPGVHAAGQRESGARCVRGVERADIHADVQRAFLDQFAHLA